MVIANFERVSNSQFKQDLKSLLNVDVEENDIKLPVRATKGSAGYDFYCPCDLVIKPGMIVKIPTGIRCKIDGNYVLNLYPRSSLGFKYQMSLLNTVGIIDADYYNADNEGHIIAGIINRGNTDIVLNKNDRFVQGVFLEYFLASEQENNNERHGGFGSTN